MQSIRVEYQPGQLALSVRLRTLGRYHHPCRQSDHLRRVGFGPDRITGFALFGDLN
jgi:hypothetical protein